MPEARPIDDYELNLPYMNLDDVVTDDFKGKSKQMIDQFMSNPFKLSPPWANIKKGQND